MWGWYMDSHLQGMIWGEWTWRWCCIKVSSWWEKARWMLLLVRSAIFTLILDGHRNQVCSCRIRHDGYRRHIVVIMG